MRHKSERVTGAMMYVVYVVYMEMRQCSDGNCWYDVQYVQVYMAMRYRG